VVLDWTTWRKVASGPHTYVQLTPGDPFRGQVQMHARMTVHYSG
jgi:hypothetical protein